MLNQRNSKNEATTVWTFMDMVRLFERTKMKKSLFEERLAHRFSKIQEDFEDLGSASDKPAMDYITLCVKSMQAMLTVVAFEELGDVREMMATGMYATISKLNKFDLAAFRGLNLKIEATIRELMKASNELLADVFASSFSAGADSVANSISVVDEDVETTKALDALYMLFDKCAVIESARFNVVDYSHSSLESDIINTVIRAFNAYQADHYVYDGQLLQLRKLVTCAEIMLADIHYGMDVNDDASAFCFASVAYTNRMHENSKASKEALDALEDTHDITLKIAHQTYLA